MGFLDRVPLTWRWNWKLSKYWFSFQGLDGKCCTLKLWDGGFCLRVHDVIAIAHQQNNYSSSQVTSLTVQTEILFDVYFAITSSLISQTIQKYVVLIQTTFSTKLIGLRLLVFQIRIKPHRHQIICFLFCSYLILHFHFHTHQNF